MKKIIIIGAGLAGLSAAKEAAERGAGSVLVSDQPSERAQSVLAQGGINAASYMEDGDSVQSHYEDTLTGGVGLADPEALRGLTAAAPRIVEELAGLGVPFHREDGRIARRGLGGQKKKRAAYARKSTGKALVTALADEVRKYEASGLVERMSHHKFVRLYLKEGKCGGCFVRDTYTDDVVFLEGPVLLACGGLNGMFGEHTTGSRSNTGEVAATIFRQGVELGNLEFVQYHPTTFSIPGKRCLVSEAARGEGGRLFVKRKGIPWYFMEEKYPELGNLMPRDVVSREMAAVCKKDDCEQQVYLDMTGVSPEVWKNGLADLKEECVKYLHIDPEKEPVPVEPGVHYFMGGILTDRNHRTNISYVYAAGECACQYHGANRMGGNSMLGAIYGGKVAAESAVRDLACREDAAETPEIEYEEDGTDMEAVSRCLAEGMGIVRSGEKIGRAARKLEKLRGRVESEGKRDDRLLLGLAMLRSAEERRESRGAHFRSDYPETDEGYKKTTVAAFDGERIQVSFRDIAGNESEGRDGCAASEAPVSHRCIRDDEAAFPEKYPAMFYPNMNDTACWRGGAR